MNATAENAAATPFQTYSSDPNAFVAPLTSTQQAGVANTNNNAGTAQPYYNAATQYTLGGAESVNPTGLNTSQYFNPFLSNVVGNTLAVQQYQNQQQNQQLRNSQVQDNAFGGDRAGIGKANLAFTQQLANSKEIADLLGQGYTQAQGVAQQQQGVGLGAAQANRQALQQTGQSLAGLGTGAQSAALQGATAQLQAGQQEQQTQQAGLSALYNQFLQQQGYPFQTAQFLANIAEGTGALSGSTTTTTQPAPFFSDERLKEDVEDIGSTHDGMRVVKFRYKGHKQKQIGLIAQDVEKHHPEAVGLAGGYKTVDYDGATHHAAALGRAKMYANGGYADGGYPDPMMGYGPPAANGLGAIPRSQVRGYVPGAALPVGKLMTAGPLPKAPDSGLAQVMAAGKNVQGIADMGKDANKAWDWTKSKFGDPVTGTTDSGATGLARGGLAGYAFGGSPDQEDTNPYDNNGAAPGLNIPDDKPNINPLKPGQMPGAPKSGFSDVVDAAKFAAKMFMMNQGGRVGFADGGAPDDVDENGNPIARKPEPQTGLGAIEQAVKTPDDPEYGTGLGTIRAREGFRSHAYGDVSPGNETRPRVGYGSDTYTDMEGTPHPVDYGTVVNQAGAERDLRRRVAQTQAGVQQSVSPEMWQSMPPGMKESLTDMAYNSGSLDKYPSLLAAIQRGDPDEIAAEMAKRGQDNGGVNVGRRNLNANLIDNGDRSTGSALAYAGDQSGLGGGQVTTTQHGPATVSRVSGDDNTGLGGMLHKIPGDKNFWIPLLTGLGAMASSNSRYFGSAALQGLGAGAQQYQNQITADTQNAQRTAETGNIEASTANKSVFQTPYGPMIRLADGRFVTAEQFNAITQANGGKAPPTMSALPGSATQRLKQWENQPDEAGIATPQAPKPLQRTMEAPPPPVEPAPEGVNYDDGSHRYAQAERATLRSLNPLDIEGARKQSEANQSKVQADYTQARDMGPGLNELTSTLSKAYNDHGIGEAGAGLARRAAIVKGINTMTRAIGLPDIVVSNTDTAKDISDKLGGVLSQNAARAGNFDGFQSLQAIQHALPDLEKTPEAGSVIAAQMLAQRQKSIDHAGHFRVYRGEAGGLTKDEPEAFRAANSDGKYAQEQQVLKDMILHQPKRLEALMNGKVDAKTAREFLIKNYGAQYAPMVRYFQTR